MPVRNTESWYPFSLWKSLPTTLLENTKIENSEKAVDFVRELRKVVDVLREHRRCDAVHQHQASVSKLQISMGPEALLTEPHALSGRSKYKSWTDTGAQRVRSVLRQKGKIYLLPLD